MTRDDAGWFSRDRARIVRTAMPSAAFARMARSPRRWDPAAARQDRPSESGNARAGRRREMANRWAWVRHATASSAGASAWPELAILPALVVHVAATRRRTRQRRSTCARDQRGAVIVSEWAATRPRCVAVSGRGSDAWASRRSRRAPTQGPATRRSGIDIRRFRRRGCLAESVDDVRACDDLRAGSCIPSRKSARDL